MRERRPGFVNLHSGFPRYDLSGGRAHHASDATVAERHGSAAGHAILDD